MFESISSLTNMKFLWLFFTQNVWDLSLFLNTCPILSSLLLTCIFCKSSPLNSILHSLISWCVLGTSPVLLLSLLVSTVSGISSAVLPIAFFTVSSINAGSYCPTGFTTHNVSFGSGSFKRGLSKRFPGNSINSSTWFNFLFLLLESCCSSINKCFIFALWVRSNLILVNSAFALSLWFVISV